MKVKSVKYKKIPKKEKAVGIAYNDKIHHPKNKVGTIEIEKKQSPKETLDTEVHELIHMKYPEMPEESVIKMAGFITRFLWKLNYRKAKKSGYIVVTKI